MIPDSRFSPPQSPVSSFSKCDIDRAATSCALLSPSSEPMTTEATTGHDIDTERASKGMNRGNDIDRAATSRALLFPSSEPMTTEANTGNPPRE